MCFIQAGGEQTGDMLCSEVQPSCFQDEQKRGSSVSFLSLQDQSNILLFLICLNTLLLHSGGWRPAWLWHILYCSITFQRSKVFAWNQPVQKLNAIVLFIRQCSSEHPARGYPLDRRPFVHRWSWGDPKAVCGQSFLKTSLYRVKNWRKTSFTANLPKAVCKPGCGQKSIYQMSELSSLLVSGTKVLFRCRSGFFPSVLLWPTWRNTQSPTFSRSLGQVTNNNLQLQPQNRCLRLQ